MALDKILIGARIRELREQIIGESREEFAQRCDLGTDRYVGQLERGEFYPSIEVLYKIADATGASLNYLLLGTENSKKSRIKNNLLTVIENSDTNELKAYNMCIMTFIEALHNNLGK